MSLDLTALSDGELAALSLAGRDAAFAEIMRRHRARVYRIALANVADADEALDLTQETFVAAHLALRRYDAARPMARWLATIALNKCRDWARRRAIRRLLRFAGPLDEDAHAVPDPRPGPETEVSDRLDLERLAHAVSRLPASQREPLVLHAIEVLSQAETGALLGISEKAVETRLRRARQRLAELLAR